MSLMRGPLPYVVLLRLPYGEMLSAEGSIGVRAGAWVRERWRIPGRCRPWSPKGLNRGECAGVASGVWSGVGESESCEKVGEEGAVELGDAGRDRLNKRCLELSSSSLEWDRDMFWE